MQYAALKLPSGEVKSGSGTPKRLCSQEPGCFYFPDFFLKDPKPWWKFANSCLPRGTSVIRPGTVLLTPFKRGFALLAKEGLQKGVPYTKQRVKIEALSFSTLLQHPGTPYFFSVKEEGIAGVTPELLFSYEGNRLMTMACAATAPAARPDRDFLSDQKERREHDFVIASIREAFPESVCQIGKREVCSFGPLKHLISMMTLTFKEAVDPEAAIRALHPTAALGAYPKKEGDAFLQQMDEILPRERFGAPFGYVEEGRGWFFVAIRCVQWKNKQAAFYAGCGVVKESVYEKEWEEVCLKLHAIQKLFAT